MKIAAALTAALVASPVNAFLGQGHPFRVSGRPVETVLFLEPEALTEYMAKAHEEKLRAVKEVEAKTRAEIERLKAEIKALKESPGALATTASNKNLDITAMTKEQLAQKLLSYQQFMAKYVVDAQEQKIKAVREAELAITRKYEEKLKLLPGGLSTTVEVTPTSTSLYQERNAKVSAAAAVGKSRWGDMENERAAKDAAKIDTTPVNGIPVNGFPVTVPAIPSSSEGLFFKRNAKVAEAGKAGKSRWGEMEVAKATQLASSAASLPPATPSSTPINVISIPVPPEVEAANHGLRADGGVGGPTLAERVNLGAQLLGWSPPAPPIISVSLYDKRNAMVAAAAKAGKSRWGEMEVQKAEKLGAVLPSSPSVSPFPVSPEVEAADHGLRADGGVGGPTLAQRVNLGAALLG